MKKLDVYTDGSYSQSRDKGGWSVYIPALDIRLCNGEYGTTINKMEVTAVIRAIDYIYNKHLPIEEVEIFTDSMYVIGGINFGWTITTNQELWNEFHATLALCSDIKFTFTHVSGHAGIEGNEIADKLAVKASTNEF